MDPATDGFPLVLSLNLALYLLYIILVGFAMYAMLPRRWLEGMKWNIASLVILFVDITAFLGVYLYTLRSTGLVLARYSYTSVPSFFDMQYLLRPFVLASVGLALIAHVVSDVIILRRCFLVWERRKVILIPQVLLLLGAAIFSIVSMVKNGASADATGPFMFIYPIYLLTSLVCTSLTVGRIYHLRRKGKGILDPHIMKKYKSVMFMILESGLLYTVFLIGYVAITFGGAGSASQAVLPLVVQISGIAPTLLLLRAALSKEHVGDLETSTPPQESPNTQPPKWTMSDGQAVILVPPKSQS